LRRVLPYKVVKIGFVHHSLRKIGKRSLLRYGVSNKKGNELSWCSHFDEQLVCVRDGARSASPRSSCEHDVRAAHGQGRAHGGLSSAPATSPYARARGTNRAATQAERDGSWTQASECGDSQEKRWPGARSKTTPGHPSLDVLTKPPAVFTSQINLRTNLFVGSICIRDFFFFYVLTRF
jgi:hypothetical protein